MTTDLIPSATDDLIAEIEAAMANATPGYWYQSKGIGVVVDHNDCGVVCETCEDNPVDAIYIAACNPSNVRQLIARIRELEDVLGMYSLPLGGDINQDCAEFGGDAVHRELMRRTVLDGSKVAPP